MSLEKLLNILLSKNENYNPNVLSSIYCLKGNHKLYLIETPAIKMRLLKCPITGSQMLPWVKHGAK